MKKVFLFAALFGCLLAMAAAQAEPEETEAEAPVGEEPAEGAAAPLENDDEDPSVKEKTAKGHFGRGGRHGFGRGRFFGRRHHHHRGGDREVDRSTCSVQASYWLSVNRERRYCVDAVREHDDCQACCEAATRRETRGVDKNDVTGFITVGGQYGRGPGRDYGRGKREAAAAYGGGKDAYQQRDRIVRERECVCCVPNNRRHHHGGFYGGYY